MSRVVRSSRTSRRTKRTPPARGNRSPRNGWIVGALLVFVALLTVVFLLSGARGSLSTWWITGLARLFGWGLYVVPLALGALGFWLISLSSERPIHVAGARVIGLGMLYLVVLALLHHFQPNPRLAAQLGQGGGWLGYLLSAGVTTALGRAGGFVVLLLIAILALTLVVNVPLNVAVAHVAQGVRRAFDWLRAALSTTSSPHRRATPPLGREGVSQPPPPLERPAEPPPAEVKRPEPAPREVPPAVVEPPAPSAGPTGAHKVPPAGWVLPKVEEVLAPTEDSQMSLPDIRQKTRVIEETLRSLGVPVTVVEVNPGPVVTQFGLEPGYVERRDRQGTVKRVKVKVSQIAALSNDLALALAASPIRIETPVPGKGVVGLEVPNHQAALVGLRGVVESDEFRGLRSRLALAFGKDVSGTPVVDDLATLPHLLIAGATGSGKSACINALIACLLFHNTPDQLRMLMVDPKRVELSTYNGIPHLLAPVVVEMDRVVGILNWVTREMDRRYRVFAEVGARHIKAYNTWALQQGQPELPYMVVFIDELADLMMVSPEEVERGICRIAQMARATGIHLVIATQRPSVDVVTGLIKANFPARICFAVSSQIDSRVVLDVPGAEKLLGRGDALYMAPDSPQLLRVQGCYVQDAELNQLASFWKNQGGGPGYVFGAGSAADKALTQKTLWPLDTEEQDEDEDPLLEQAMQLVLRERKASVSFLQRVMGIGYSRAARLIDTLEAQGVVGPATGSSRAREVLRKPAAAEDDGRTSGASLRP